MSADLYARAHAEIDQLMAVERAATPGDWRAHDTWLPHGGYAATVMSGSGNAIDIRAWLPTFSEAPRSGKRNVYADAAFIAESRNIFPALLAIARDALATHAPDVREGTCGHCDDTGCHNGHAWPCPEARQVLETFGVTE